MEPVLIGVFAILGAILGSFANVCIWRLPRGESIVWPPSHCVHCQERLRPWQLVPVLSWLWLRGRCAFCGKAISFQYPLVEFTSALLFGVIYWQWGPTVLALKYFILSLALLIAVGTDFSHREIPDQVSLGAAALLAIVDLIVLDWSAFIGGAILFSFLLLIAVVSRGGMGGGDIKLALAIGLALGWQLALVALVLAILLGGLPATIMLAFGKKGQALPFGPFLALGAWVAMFFGSYIIELYIALSLSLWKW